LGITAKDHSQKDGDKAFYWDRDHFQFKLQSLGEFVFKFAIIFKYNFRNKVHIQMKQVSFGYQMIKYM
jgi:hypothetical protein